MAKILIVVAALVAGLVVVASAQEKNKEYFDHLSFELEYNKIGYKESIFAVMLGKELFRNCAPRPVGERVFAEKLADESSDSYKCAVEQLANPEVLASVLMFSPSNPDRENSDQFFQRIRDHSLGSKNLKVIEAAIPDNKRACEKYVAGIAPFFAEAESNQFSDSITYDQNVLARSACQVFLKSNISKETIAAIGKYATSMVDGEKRRQKEMARQQKKMDKEMERRFRS